MPDRYGFDHLPHRGVVYHRCIECGWPDRDAVVSDSDRSRHHLTHERARKRESEKARLAALAKARKAKRQQARENSLAYRQEGEQE